MWRTVLPLPLNENTGRGPHRGWLHTHGATLVDLYRIVDFAWILGGLRYTASRLESGWDDAHLTTALLAAGLFTFFAALWPLYRSWRVAPLRTELARAGLCWIASIAGISLVSYAVDAFPGSQDPLIPAWTAATLLGILGTRAAVRIALRTLRLQGRNFRSAAIIGATEAGKRLAHVIRNTSWMGLRLKGYYDDRSAMEGRTEQGVETDGTFDDLLALVRSGEVDIVYIALPLRSELRIREMLHQLRDSTVTVCYVPDFNAFGLLRPHWEDLKGVPVVSLIDTPHEGVDALSKRLFDIVVASVILVAVAIPMVVIAIAIALGSRGPIIFTQKRYGLNGKEFEIWKFRTMSVCEDGTNTNTFRQATRADVRITPVGAFLRRTSLDELPQFFNVLQGRMSIVGPRPHPVALNETQRKLIDGYMLRHKVKPGITGWAQINGYRGETDVPEKMLGRIQYDLEYIENWSIGLDIRIIAMTLGRVLDDPNAY